MKTRILLGLTMVIVSLGSTGRAEDLILTTTAANNVFSKSTIHLQGIAGNQSAIIVPTPIDDTAKLKPHPIGAWFYNGKWRHQESEISLLSAACIVVHATTPLSVTSQTTPESRVKDFYSWYLKSVANGKDPTKNKTLTDSYLSARFSRWYYSKAGQNADHDVFINSQEWNDAWADNIEVGEAVLITDNKAALHVMFRSPPDEFVMKLLVKLLKEGGKWKIDSVNSLFD